MNILTSFGNVLIPLVWLVNGLYCKILNFTPRHQLIVERILHLEDGRTLTVLIGIAELFICVWIITGYQIRVLVWLQIAIILLMNSLELYLAKDLLLWGSFNSVFALVFCLFIYIHHRVKYPIIPRRALL